MSYHRPRKCPICGNQMTMRLTTAPDIQMVCTHPHTVAMIEEFIARTNPHTVDDGQNHEEGKRK